MRGELSGLRALEVRKKLLLAEGDLQRALLLEDLTDLRAQSGRLAQRARSVVALASTAVVALAGVSAWRRKAATQEADSPSHPSWMNVLIKGIRVGASLWFALRSRPR